ncbi:hypothetical protein CYMTET_5463, partial [Cymbomonas tetramitiformis]
MNLSSVQLIPELKDAATDYQEFKNYSLPLNLQSLTSAVERVTSFPPLPTPSTTKKREPDLPLHAKQDKRGIFGWFKARKKKALRQTVEEEPKAEETIQGEAGEVPLAKSPATAPSVKPIGVQVGAPLPEKSKGDKRGEGAPAWVDLNCTFCDAPLTSHLSRRGKINVTGEAAAPVGEWWRKSWRDLDVDTLLAKAAAIHAKLEDAGMALDARSKLAAESSADRSTARQEQMQLIHQLGRMCTPIHHERDCSRTDFVLLTDSPLAELTEEWSGLGGRLFALGNALTLACTLKRTLLLDDFALDMRFSSIIDVGAIEKAALATCRVSLAWCPALATCPASFALRPALATCPANLAPRPALATSPASLTLR